jgi:HEAT repeat protein
MTQANECVTFSDVIAQLKAGAVALSSPMVYALTAPASRDIKEFALQWPALPVEQRVKIISILAEQAEANFELDFHALFRVAMGDTDGQVRAVAIEGLWEDEEPTLIRPLVRVLQDDPVIAARAAAATSLGRFVLLLDLDELDERYADPVHSALVDAVGDPEEDLEVRRRAVESIAYWDDPSVADIIGEAYQSEDESMRVSAVFAMGRSADPSWAESVCEELASPNPAMRYEAARAAGELGVKAALPALIKLTTDRDREVQLAAITALGQVGGQRAKEVLERCARSPDEALNLAAEDALAELVLGRKPLDMLVMDGDADLDEDQPELDDEGDADEDTDD